MGIVSCNVFVEVFGSLVSTYRLFVVGTCHRSRPPSSQIASAVQSDCVRHPIRLRPPSDQIAFAVRSDCVRHPIRLRSVSDGKISTTTALTLRLLFANTQLLLSKRK